MHPNGLGNVTRIQLLLDATSFSITHALLGFGVGTVKAVVIGGTIASSTSGRCWYTATTVQGDGFTNPSTLTLIITHL